MNSLFINAFDGNDQILVEDCPAGDRTIEITDVDAEDLRVLHMLVGLESFRVSRALGAFFDFAYSRGLRDARGRLATA